jgi:hypothetical protein
MVKIAEFWSPGGQPGACSEIHRILLRPYDEFDDRVLDGEPQISVRTGCDAKRRAAAGGWDWILAEEA